MIHITDLSKGTKLFEALNSSVRIEILSMLKESGEANLNQLAKGLGLTNGALTAHIKKLEDAGLIAIDSRAGIRGSQKMCSIATEKIIIDMFDEDALLKDCYSFQVGIGHYIDYNVSPTCGIVTDTSIIGELDDPRYFSFPERINAGLLWFSQGYVTYQLPNNLKIREECTELQIGVELSSEAPGFSSYYPSDVNFYVNDVDVGFFTLPGEFNDRKGIFTPAWWYENLAQYGKLKLLTINNDGCFIDGFKISHISIAELNIFTQSDITFKIAVNPDAVNKGGVNIFGTGFGDHDTAINVKMFYRKVGPENYL